MVGQLGRKVEAGAFQILHPGASRPARVDDDIPEHGGVGGRTLYQCQFEAAGGGPGVINGDRQLTAKEALVEALTDMPMEVGGGLRHRRNRAGAGARRPRQHCASAARARRSGLTSGDTSHWHQCTQRPKSRPVCER